MYCCCYSPISMYGCCYSPIPKFSCCYSPIPMCYSMVLPLLLLLLLNIATSTPFLPAPG